jgi:hypothetical protein
MARRSALGVEEARCRLLREGADATELEAR